MVKSTRENGEDNGRVGGSVGKTAYPTVEWVGFYHGGRQRNKPICPSFSRVMGGKKRGVFRQIVDSETGGATGTMYAELLKKKPSTLWKRTSEGERRRKKEGVIQSGGRRSEVGFKPRSPH